MVHLTEKHEEYQKMIMSVAGGSETGAEQKLQGFLVTVRRMSLNVEEHVEKFECGDSDAMAEC